MSARDVIARAAGGKWPFKGYAPGSYICQCSMCNDIFEGDKRACHCPSCALTIAGYRILGPGELDVETVEKCAQVAERAGKPVGASDGGTYVVGGATDAAAAIRALASGKSR